MRSWPGMFCGVTLALAGCASDGVGSPNTAPSSPGSPLPPPPPPPPPPQNTTLSSLVASQDFTNDATTLTTALELASAVVQSGSGSSQTMTVHYDASTKDYTVTAPGRTQTFTPAEQVGASGSGVTVYGATGGGYTDHLTLVNVSQSNSLAGKLYTYVGFGFWQHDQVNGSTQNTTYDTFAYGLPTDPSGVPRTGTATYTSDLFGVYTKPGVIAEQIQGGGSFNVDFQAGVFSVNAYATQSNIGSSLPKPGTANFLGAGTLSATDGTFSGTISYQDTNGVVAGPLNGRLDGPAGQELGGSFDAQGGGSTFVGSLIAGNTANVAEVNLTLTHIVASQTFYASVGQLGSFINPDGTYNTPNAMEGISDLSQAADGSFTFADPNGDQAGHFSSSDQVAGPKNFTTYQTTIDSDVPVTLSMYTPGAGNAELQLTYLSFGIWRQGSTTPGSTLEQDYFTYGVRTPDWVLSHRTGAASYSGVAYASAVTPFQTTRHDLTGTSSYSVDFSAQTLTGSFGLAGAPPGGGSSRDFGTFSFSGTLGANGGLAPVTQGGQTLGQIDNKFYGPTGEEVGGVFTMTLPGPVEQATKISGVAVAKRVGG